MNDSDLIIKRHVVNIPLIIIGLVFVFLFAVHIVNPTDMEFIKCGFKETTGYSCPTCGFTRAVYSLSNFQIADSFYYNPFAIIIIFYILIIQLKKIVYIIFPGEFSLHTRLFPNKLVIQLIFFTWMIYWILKILLESGVV